MTSCCFESEFQQLRTSCEFGAYTCRQCSGQMPHAVMVSHGKSYPVDGFNHWMYLKTTQVDIYAPNPLLGVV